MLEGYYHTTTKQAIFSVNWLPSPLYGGPRIPAAVSQNTCLQMNFDQSYL